MSKKLFSEEVAKRMKEEELEYHYNVMRAYPGDIEVTMDEPYVSDVDERKSVFIYSAFEFFPHSFQELGKVIGAGQAQHISGETESPVWDREKSNQHMQSLARHLADYASGEKMDDDGTYHLAKIAFRCLAQLQQDIEDGK